jgi:hypothetical protein
LGGGGSWPRGAAVNVVMIMMSMMTGLASCFVLDGTLYSLPRWVDQSPSFGKKLRRSFFFISYDTIPFSSSNHIILPYLDILFSWFLGCCWFWFLVRLWFIRMYVIKKYLHMLLLVTLPTYPTLPTYLPFPSLPAILLRLLTIHWLVN